MAYTPKTLAQYAAEALASSCDTYPSKAAQKRVLETLNHAYSQAREIAMVAIRNEAPEITIEDREDVARMVQIIARNSFFNTNDLPFDLHAVRARHIPYFNAVGIADDVRALIDLREATKSAEICKPAPKNADLAKLEERVRKSVSEIYAMRKNQYEFGLRMADIFGRLDVSVNTHWVTNQFGTTFTRCFYYMEGKLTPLNLILAVLQEHERRTEATAAA